MAYSNPFQQRKPRPLSSVMFGQQAQPQDYTGLPQQVMDTARSNYGAAAPAARPGALAAQAPGSLAPAMLAPSAYQAAPMAPSAPAAQGVSPQAPAVPGQVNFTKDPYGTQAQNPQQKGHPGEVGARDSINSMLGFDLGQQGNINTLIANLLYKSGASGMDNLAQAHAGEFSDINKYYDQGRQRLEQSLASRGMRDSTAYGTGVGAFEGARASGLGRERAALTGEDLQRQDRAQSQLQGILQFLTGQGQSLAENKANRKMSKWQLRQQQKQANQINWGEILGMLAQAGAAYGTGGASAAGGMPSWLKNITNATSTSNHG